MIKSWAPHTICGSCRSNREGCLRNSRKSMPFAIPRTWRKPKNHIGDYCFFMVSVVKYRKVRGSKALMHANILLSIAPVSHDESLPAPSPLQNVSYAKRGHSKRCLCNTGVLNRGGIPHQGRNFVFRILFKV